MRPVGFADLAAKLDLSGQVAPDREKYADCLAEEEGFEPPRPFRV
jgi:hypothetical protein